MNDILPEKLSVILKRIALAVTLICILAGVGHFYYLKKAFEREGRYTVCVMLDKIPRTSGGFALQYAYKVDGRQYRDDVYVHAMNDFSILEHHYLVEFVESNPKLHRVLFDKPLVKGADIPADGWENVPERLIERGEKK